MYFFFIEKIDTCIWVIDDSKLPLYGNIFNCALIIKRYKRVGYNLDIMRQSSCLVVKPITVDSFCFLFNCTTVGQASDLKTALTLSFNPLVGV